MSTTNNPNQITIKNARLAFADLFQAKAFDNNTPRYGAKIILDKVEHAAVIAEIKKIIANLQAEYKAKGKTIKPGVVLQEGTEKAAFEGFDETNMFVSAYKRPPQKVVTLNKDKTPVREEDAVFYSGCYCHFKVSFYVPEKYNVVAASLDLVMFHRDGQAIGGGHVSTDDLDAEPLDPLA